MIPRARYFRAALGRDGPYLVVRERHGSHNTVVAEVATWDAATEVIRAQEELDRDDYDRERGK